MKSVLWKLAKRLSYIQDARCLKVNYRQAEWNQVKIKNFLEVLSFKLNYDAASCIMNNLFLFKPHDSPEF